MKDKANFLKFLTLKHCTDCGGKRRFAERLFAIDDDLCDVCYFRFVQSVRERYDCQ